MHVGHVGGMCIGLARKITEKPKLNEVTVKLVLRPNATFWSGMPWNISLVTCIFHRIRRESVAQPRLFYHRKYCDKRNQWKIRAAHDGKVGCDTVEYTMKFPVFWLAVVSIAWNKTNYYSFKIFPRFWLVKTTRTIHHNQLLFTKFGKNLRHIESMTSKVRPAENYFTNEVKITSKVQAAADYWTVDRENLGTRLCYIWWAEKQRA